MSTSRGLLNLWEASPSAGRGEAALTVLHSQMTDYLVGSVHAHVALLGHIAVLITPCV